MYETLFRFAFDVLLDVFFNFVAEEPTYADFILDLLYGFYQVVRYGYVQSCSHMVFLMIAQQYSKVVYSWQDDFDIIFKP